MPNNIDSKPWERVNGETTKAYEAFCLYIGMGPERSIRKVAEQLHKSSTLIGRWSRTYDWVRRAADYDEHLQEEKFKETRKKTRKMADRHISMALQMQEVALKRLKGLDPEEIDVKNLITLIRESTKLERENREDVERRENPRKEESMETGNTLADVITDAWERRKADGKL